MSNRIYKQISQGVYRVLVRKKNKWDEPERGSKYFVRKTISSGSGKSVRVCKGFNDYQDALRFRDGRIEFHARESARGMLFSELLEQWKENALGHLAISTQIRYKSYLKHFLFFEGMSVSRIVPAAIDAYISHLKSPEYLASQNSTRLDYRHELSLLKGILGYYQSRYDSDYRMPFLKDHAKMVKIKDGKEKVKDLSTDDLAKFLVVLKSITEGTKHECIFYLACLQYGLCSRVQEAAALHHEDFDLDNGKVTIDKKIVWPRGKGLKPFLTQGSKTNEGKRLPLSEFARTKFLEWTVKSGVRNGMLFTAIDGKPLEYRVIVHKYDKALKQAGLAFRGTHILRHASLTELYELTSDIKVVAKFAGHASIKTTEVYAKARDSKIAEATVLFDKKLEGLAAIGSKSKNQSTDASVKLLKIQGLKDR